MYQRVKVSYPDYMNDNYNFITDTGKCNFMQENEIREVWCLGKKGLKNFGVMYLLSNCYYAILYAQNLDKWN